MKGKASAKETWTDVLLEFIEAAVHEFLDGEEDINNLYSCFIYAVQILMEGLSVSCCIPFPTHVEAFERRVIYDVPIHMCRHPLLCEYIHSMLAGCRSWILRGEIEKLCIVVLSKEGRVIETLVVEVRWTVVLTEQAQPDVNPSIPLVQIEEALREAMVALVAMPVTIGHEESCKPNSFRILAHTVEDASKPGTTIDEDDVGNSWVLADPFWCEEQSSERNPMAISPLKSIQANEFPFRMQLYTEKKAD